ncbi:MAG: hypothetical protein AB7U35_01055 [Sphingobium sp.]
MMAASPPEQVHSPPPGQPLRVLGLVLLAWICVRALVGTSVLADGLGGLSRQPATAKAAPAIREAPQKPRLAKQAAPPAGASAQLKAPVRDAPRLGHYYGPIEAAAPIAQPRIERAPIMQASAMAEYRRQLAEVALRNRRSAVNILDAIPVPMPSAPARAHATGVSVPPVRNDGARGDEGRGDRANGDLWSGSAWAFWRERKAVRALGSAGQLGGAQAGVRIDRRLVRIAGAPLSAYGRVSSALYRPYAPEAALGLAARGELGILPVSFGIERRFALDGDGRNAFALVATTGLYPTRIFGGLIAEGYAQGGMVGFSRTDAFVDGRFSLAMPLDRNGRFSVGGSVSGGAQPGVSRLDAGPMIELRLPAGGVSPRLLVEWRRRVAGRAAPGSGFAVTLATDF